MKSNRIIDTHVHIGHFHNSLYKVEYLDSLWENGVTEAWGSSLSASTVGMRFGNNEMLKALEKEPRLKGLVWVVPYNPDWEKILKEYLAAGFIGIKLHPPMDCYEPTEEFMRPVFEIANDQKIPVFLHAHKLNLFDEYIAKYQDMTLVVYHMGGFDGINLALNHPNVLLELSWCDYQKTATAYNALGANRLLFGTDAPFRMVKNPVVDLLDGQYKTYRERGLDKIEQLHCSHKDLQKILFENADLLRGKDENK